jgi:glutathione reductase (NADPH)
VCCRTEGAVEEGEGIFRLRPGPAVFRPDSQPTSHQNSFRPVEEKYSGYKMLVEEGTDRILGAHLLGGEAGEVINIFVLAIRSGISATDFKRTIFSYPTHSSDLPYTL